MDTESEVVLQDPCGGITRAHSRSSLRPIESTRLSEEQVKQRVAIARIGRGNVPAQHFLRKARAG